MSISDHISVAITARERDRTHKSARAGALQAATPGTWLAMVLEHHGQIEEAFAEVKAATTLMGRVAAQHTLAVILTGHANAEESVLYPALAAVDERSQATAAYAEQALAKMQMAALERLAPMSQDYLDLLEQIRHAVSNHIYEEERHWLMELKARVPVAEQSKLTMRYMEEFDRYVADDHDDPPLLQRAADAG
jgi:hemerythrin superfamily protein